MAELNNVKNFIVTIIGESEARRAKLYRHIFKEMEILDNCQKNTVFQIKAMTNMTFESPLKGLNELNGLIVMYDITNSESYDSLVKWMISNSKKKLLQNKPILILGDMVGDDALRNRKVGIEKGIALANSENKIFEEISADDGFAVNKAIRKLISKTL